MGKENRKALSSVQFYRACEALRKNKQQFLDRRPDKVEASNMLTTLCGFAVSKVTVNKLQEATGITWTVSRSVGATRRPTGNGIRTLTRAVMALYRKLGEEPTTGLKNLHDHLFPPDGTVATEPELNQ